MKIALAQLNSRVADVAGNLARIRDLLGRASRAGAELVVFPEQAVGGYPALDLWEDAAFIRANEQAVKALARETRHVGLLIGYAGANPRRRGKPALNACALLHKGKVLARRAKTLLPTYDVFDETRYFEPAAANAPVPFKGVKLGVTICEDAWARELGTLYSRDPVAEQARAGAKLLINISASPFTRRKLETRRRLLAAHAKAWKRPMLYCNAVGGNDEVILDGASLVFDGRGRLCAAGKFCDEDLVLVDTDRLEPARAAWPDETGQLLEALTLGLRDYVRKCGQSKVLVGLSGGIDSAVVCALAARALGPGNVTGVSMPSRYSSGHSRTDAEQLARALGVGYRTLAIEPVFNAYLETLGPLSDLAEQNLQPRVRGALLMALSNNEGGLVLSTGNKSELSVGYCTLYGDMAGGLAPLADVTKRDVYALARRLPGIPEGSITKPPSAELKPGQTDQDDLPPYDVVDDVIEAYVERRQTPKDARGLLDRIDRAEYKRRQAPPSLKVSSKAYGVGRRMPIARGSYR